MRAVALFVLGALSAAAVVSPEKMDSRSGVAQLTMDGLEQEAISTALSSRHRAEMEQDAADHMHAMRQSKRRSTPEAQRLRGMTEAARHTQQVELQRMEKKAMELHSKKDSQENELLSAVKQYKAKQAKQQQQLKHDASMQRADDLAQRVQLTDAALSRKQDATLERREKEWEAKKAKLEFLKQAQELSAQAISAIGTKREKRMSEAAQQSHLRTLALEGEYQQAKRSVAVEAHRVKMEGQAEDVLITKELKYKTQRASENANRLVTKAKQDVELKKEENANDIQRWKKVQKGNDAAIPVHGAWRLGDTRAPARELNRAQPCTSVERLMNDPLCRFDTVTVSTKSDMQLAQEEVHEVEKKLNNN